MSPKTPGLKTGCCDHGGKRPGCGRKPGIKTQPIRLPRWLLEQLHEKGDARQLIIEACISQYQLCSDKTQGTDD
ncbi:hypothetical protein [Motiliproteus sp. MSK22-1]|uniref:hypothetical protein n=1 Tax=Motiliproteus sp. MSK22-1 TaxID=1897630 RepID=UPI00097858C6|nr:hypothetical protein [Motiliproteus sp. MSK22-1]OMH36199.1 hypothetical protein BGP75_10180 [Motiliproteus sp. MSK22-1]